MKNFIKYKLALIALISISFTANAVIQGTSFTYQGEILENGIPVNGLNSFRVGFFDSLTNGAEIAPSTDIDTTVVNGIFTLEIDIGDMPFNGNAIWIELTLNPTFRGGAPTVVFTPRQLITNSPYAIQAQFVGTNGVNTLAIKNATVTTAKLANNSVTTNKIVDGDIKVNDIDSTQIQERVVGTCSAGSSIRAIAQNGLVTCEADDVGTPFAGWGVTGNAGTDSTTNFIGTTDAEDLNFKVNNYNLLKLTTDNNILFSSSASNSFTGSFFQSSILGGNSNSIISSGNSVIAGGEQNKLGENGVNTQFSAISGGLINTLKAYAGVIGGGNDNEISGVIADFSTISGGNDNKITGKESNIAGGYSNSISSSRSAIAGGENNSISGSHSTIVGGKYNSVSSSYGLAAGFGSIVSHDGGWVWNDYSDIDLGDSFETTANNQFLVRAVGGFGIGTNAPVAPLHIKGQGTSNGSIASSNEVVMTIEPKLSTESVAAVINKLDASEEAALIFSTSNNPNFDLRSIQNVNSRDQLDFNHYDSMDNKQTLMSFEYWNSPFSSTIFMNVDVFVDTGNTYSMGSSTKRWANIYTENIHTRNAVDVDSDKRLKDEIKDINYGLADILALRPVSYFLKADKEQKIQLGLIAQEVETIIPEIVNKTKDEKQMRSMSYTELVPVLIKATQEQQALIEQQNQKITLLETMLEKLMTQSNK